MHTFFREERYSINKVLQENNVKNGPAGLELDPRPVRNKLSLKTGYQSRFKERLLQ